MYPRGLDLNGTDTLAHEVSPDTFHHQEIPNDLVFFVDGGEGSSLTDKRSIACILACIFGVAIHWHASTQPDCSAHSTHSEIRSFFLATKTAQFLCLPLLQSGLQATREAYTYI